MEPSAGIVLARLAEYLATSVLFGGPLFLVLSHRGGAIPHGVRRWPWWVTLAAALLTLVSTLVWVMAETAAMSGDPAQATDAGALWSMLSETPFGVAAIARTAASALATAALLASPQISRARLAGVAGLGATAVASLAWSGHGVADEGAAGLVHLGADLLHLLAAAAWIGALVVLAMLVVRAGRSEAEAGIAQRALASFSGAGTLIVAVLGLSGLVNAWFLIGPAHLDAMTGTLYGRLLLAKLIIFAGMLCLAAANRFVLTPRLQDGPAATRSNTTAVRALRHTVVLETLLAVSVLALVSWFGALAPPSVSAG